MKTTTPKKTESNKITLSALKIRLRKPRQRAVSFKSGKDYSRRVGKGVGG